MRRPPARPASRRRRLALVWAACAACTAPPPPPDGTADGVLVFVEPSAGAAFTERDDVLALQAGIQLRVSVRALWLPEGAPVSLTVDGVPEGAPVPVADGRAVFFPTFQGGPPPEGLEHRLAASAAGAAGARTTLRVTTSDAVACRFGSPLPDAVLSAAEDASTEAGFQVDAAVECSGGRAAEGSVVVEVWRGEPDGAPEARVEQPLVDGNAHFPALTLPDGSVALGAYLRRGDGTRTGHQRVRVTVDAGRCDVVLRAPSTAGWLTTRTVRDMDPGRAGLDAAVVADSRLCPSGTLVVDAPGGAVEAPVSLGTGRAVVALPEGSVSLVVGIRDVAGGREDALPVRAAFRVDTVAPCASLSWPPAGGTVTAADDEQVPPDPADGVTVTLRGRVVHGEGTEAVDLRLLGPDDALVLHASLPISADGFFQHTAPALAPGNHAVLLSAVDDHGNRCPAAPEAAAPHRFRVDTRGPAASAHLLNDVGGDGWIGRDEDAAPDEPGTQVNARVTLAGAAPAGASARLRFTSAEGVTLDLVVPLSGASADARATLADGEYVLGAVVSFTDGRPNLGAPVVRFAVDTLAPSLVMLAPADGSVIRGRTLDVTVLGPPGDPLRMHLEVAGVPWPAEAEALDGGRWRFPAVALPAGPGPHLLTARGVDRAGNPGTAQAAVTVDDTAPAAVLRGVDRDGTNRVLEGPAAGSTQPRTLLDISTPEGLAALDYDSNADTGLQYAFAVEVPVEDCPTVAAARLAIQGLADALAVTLRPAGAVCRGVVDRGGLGLTLPEGDGTAVVAVTDVAGNVGSAAVFYTVRRSGEFARIDEPADGAHLSAARVDVKASAQMLDGAACQLLVDGATVGQVPVATRMVFPGVATPATDGASSQLTLRCTRSGGGTPVLSQPVTVFRDTAAPVGTFRLRDGRPLPAFLNAAEPSDAPGPDTRLFKDLALDVDADDAGCQRLLTPLLRAEPANAAARTYDARQSVGGYWAYQPGTGTGSCRAVFPLVDLGAWDEPDLVTRLVATLQDTAGNTATVEASVVTDRVAPTLTRVRPRRDRQHTTDDAFPALEGMQLVVEARVDSDGRPGRARLLCGAAECGAEREASATGVVFGELEADAVTVGAAGAALAVAMTLETRDAAGNLARLTWALEVVAGPAVFIDAPAMGTRFNARGTAGATGDLDPATAGVQASIALDARECGTTAAPGELAVTVAGVLAATAAVTTDGPVGFTTTLAEGPQVVLLATCAPAAGPTVGDVVLLNVDGVPPAAGSVDVEVLDARRGVLRLRFVAPGDDGETGALPPGGYRLGWRQGSAPDSTWLRAQEWPADPGPAGTREAVELRGVLPGDVFAGVLAVDDAGNETLLSAPAVTVAWRTLSVAVPGLVALAPRTLDADGDGLDDVVAATGDAATVLHGGTPPLARTARLVGGTWSHDRVHVVDDLDGDGLAEVVAASLAPGGGVALWLGRADGWADGAPPDATLMDDSRAGAAGQELGAWAAVGYLDGAGLPWLLLGAPCGGAPALAPRVWALRGGSRAALVGGGILGLDAARRGGWGLCLEGPAGSRLGAGGALLGNLDADAAPELALGAPGAGAGAGAVVMVPMDVPVRGGFTTVLPATPDVSGWTLEGEAGAGLGASLAFLPEAGQPALLLGQTHGPPLAAELRGTTRPLTVPWSTTNLPAVAASGDDLDGDGRLDAVGSGGAVWLGRPHLGPRAAPDAVLGTADGLPVVADVDGDGVPDLVLHGENALTVLY
ncbi:MAG: hypothetical protein HY904_00615 [Deltaproteobacteria bacterium]|nr:hypothetical protein [Deltaproteobacteria bacterium]